MLTSIQSCHTRRSIGVKLLPIKSGLGMIWHMSTSSPMLLTKEEEAKLAAQGTDTVAKVLTVLNCMMCCSHNVATCIRQSTQEEPLAELGAQCKTW